MESSSQPPRNPRSRTESIDTVLFVIEGLGDNTRRPRRPSTPDTPNEGPTTDDNTDQPDAPSNPT